MELDPKKIVIVENLKSSQPADSLTSNTSSIHTHIHEIN